MNATLQLLMSGMPAPASGFMDLMIPGPSSSYVYNNVDLVTFGCSGIASGSMPLYIDAPSGVASGALNLNMTSTQTTEQLNLRVRGK